MMKILRTYWPILGETEINISLINENSNDINNTELGGSITIDEPSINRATLKDEG